MFDLVIFDCDGVLVDSEILATQVTCQVLADIGLSMSVTEAISVLVGFDARIARRKLEEALGCLLPVDFESRVASRLNEAFNSRLQPISGMTELLQNLSYPFCVTSNSGHERLRCTFSATGLSSLVDGRVFSAEDVAQGKPAPDLFMHAARTMGHVPADRCLVIEDSLTGVTAARAANMKVIGFCGGAHIQPGHDRELLLSGAERICTQTRQLAELLGSSADN